MTTAAQMNDLRASIIIWTIVTAITVLVSYGWMACLTTMMLLGLIARIVRFQVRASA